MVIIDGRTGRVKFFQAKGYSTRGEDAGEILRGKPFQAKRMKRTIGMYWVSLSWSFSIIQS